MQEIHIGFSDPDGDEISSQIDDPAELRDAKLHFLCNSAVTLLFLAVQPDDASAGISGEQRQAMEETSWRPVWQTNTLVFTLPGEHAPVTLADLETACAMFSAGMGGGTQPYVKHVRNRDAAR